MTSGKQTVSTSSGTPVNAHTNKPPTLIPRDDSNPVSQLGGQDPFPMDREQINDDQLPAKVQEKVNDKDSQDPPKEPDTDKDV